MDRKTNHHPTLSPVVNRSPLLTWSPDLKKHILELPSSEVWALSCKFYFLKIRKFQKFNQFEKLKSLELEAVMGGGLLHFLPVALCFPLRCGGGGRDAGVEPSVLGWPSLVEECPSSRGEILAFLLRLSTSRRQGRQKRPPSLLF